MNRYVFNTAILTTYGTFRLTKISPDEAIAFLREPGWTSAIGHQGTAELLTQLSGVPVAVNRITTRMELGDIALVVRLVERMHGFFELTLDELRSRAHEYAILEMMK